MGQSCFAIFVITIAKCSSYEFVTFSFGKEHSIFYYHFINESDNFSDLISLSCFQDMVAPYLDYLYYCSYWVQQGVKYSTEKAYHHNLINRVE